MVVGNLPSQILSGFFDTKNLTEVRVMDVATVPIRSIQGAVCDTALPAIPFAAANLGSPMIGSVAELDEIIPVMAVHVGGDGSKFDRVLPSRAISVDGEPCPVPS